MSRLRVLVVDDSRPLRLLLRGALEEDLAIQVVGEFDRAEPALDAIARERPDLVLMDVVLPGIDGFEAVRRIMRDYPVPVVVVSGASRREEAGLTVKALHAGALGAIEKPMLHDATEVERFARRLRRLVVSLSEVSLVRHRPALATARARPRAADAPRRHAPARCDPSGDYSLIGIAASTGGPAAVQRVLADIGPDFPLPVAVVQHISPGFAAGFADWLAATVPFAVRTVGPHDEPAEAGVVYLPPPERHLRVTASGLRACADPPQNYQRPSADVLLRSMASHLGPRGVGVVLTGMGDDGAAGLLALREAGGHTLVEHESTTVVNGMPRAAAEIGAACMTLALHDIGDHVRSLTTRPAHVEVNS